jgi:aminoglycoside phosphotransferase (APT) family kinase protein
MQMHANQLVVSVETVRELVDEQFPEWQRLSIRQVASQGTVNALFRIGERFVARFPLESGDVESTRRWLQSEAQAARELFERTRFRTPEPVALGEPGAGYPLPWSVQTWLPGSVATDEDPGESVAFAHDLAEFVHGVRALDTHGRVFKGRGRGGDLRSRAAASWAEAWQETHRPAKAAQRYDRFAIEHLGRDVTREPNSSRRRSKSSATSSGRASCCRSPVPPTTPPATGSPRAASRTMPS